MENKAFCLRVLKVLQINLFISDNYAVYGSAG